MPKARCHKRTVPLALFAAAIFMDPHCSGNGTQPHALSFLKAGCLWFTLSWSFYFRSHAVLNCPFPGRAKARSAGRQGWQLSLWVRDTPSHTLLPVCTSHRAYEQAHSCLFRGTSVQGHIWKGCFHNGLPSDFQTFSIAMRCFTVHPIPAKGLLWLCAHDALYLPLRVSVPQLCLFASTTI